MSEPSRKPRHYTFKEWILRNPEAYALEETCFTCHGEKYVECSYCHGSGCPFCDELGSNDCDECDGKGVMNSVEEQYRDQLREDKERWAVWYNRKFLHFTFS